VYWVVQKSCETSRYSGSGKKNKKKVKEVTQRFCGVSEISGLGLSVRKGFCAFSRNSGIGVLGRAEVL
jgi:hypothetical protein